MDFYLMCMEFILAQNGEITLTLSEAEFETYQ